MKRNDGSLLDTIEENVTILLIVSIFCLCLSQFQLPTSPPPSPRGNPQGLAQKNSPGGRDLTFGMCPGAGFRQGPGFSRKWRRMRAPRFQLVRDKCETFSFVFLDFTSTRGKHPFSHAKTKASA